MPLQLAAHHCRTPRAPPPGSAATAAPTRMAQPTNQPAAAPATAPARMVQPTPSLRTSQQYHVFRQPAPPVPPCPYMRVRQASQSGQGAQEGALVPSLLSSPALPCLSFAPVARQPTMAPCRLSNNITVSSACLAATAYHVSRTLSDATHPRSHPLSTAARSLLLATMHPLAGASGPSINSTGTCRPPFTAHTPGSGNAPR